MKLTFKKHFHNYLYFYSLGLLLLISAILHFYNFPYRYGLGDETIRDVAVAITGAKDIQFPLTGPFSSAGAFTFGPWYYYQLILFQLLIPTYYSSWIYLSLTSIASIYFLFKIGVIILNKKLGILLAFLGVSSPSILVSGTHLTNPNLASLFAFVSIYLFLHLYSKGITFWKSLLFGICLGIAINMHYQMVGLLILPLILVILKPKDFKKIFFIGVGMGITFIPLLFFELTNHWYNTQGFLYYYTEGRKLIYLPNRWLFYIRDFWPSYSSDVTGLPRAISFIPVLGAFGILGLQIYKRKIDSKILLLACIFLIQFVMLRYYWGERTFGYLHYIRPLVLIMEGYFIYMLIFYVKKTYLKYALAFILIGLVLISAWSRMYPILQKDPFTMSMIEFRDQLYAQYPNEKFAFYKCEGKGNTNFSSQEHSMIYLLDKDKRLSAQGHPISIKNPDCVDGPVLKSTNLVELKSDDLLENTGLILYSLRSIHDSTIRWWFREQP